jgi:uncharacterized membrane protein
MSTRTTTFIVLLMLVVTTLAGLLLWDRLPDPMASHWNIDDQVDGYMSRFWGVFLLPLITLGMFVLFLIVPGIDPLKANIAQFRPAFNLFVVLMVAFMVYLYSLTLAWNLGYTNFRMSGAMLPAIGLLFIFIGFLMRRARRNFFIGIRTPWTLSSDAVWNETHRVGAVLFMISGALAFIGGLFGGTIAFWMLFAPIMGTTVFLLAYSYVIYRRETGA